MHQMPLAIAMSKTRRQGWFPCFVRYINMGEGWIEPGTPPHLRGKVSFIIACLLLLLLLRGTADCHNTCVYTASYKVHFFQLRAV